METIKMEIKGETLKVKLSRPDQRNAVSSTMIRELGEACKVVEETEKIKSMVLIGEGKVFCAGADLKEIGKLYGKAKHEFTKSAQKLLRRIEKLPALVVAAMNGHAFGGGLELALACDIRILVENAKIGLTEVTLGLIPAWGGTQRLPKVIGLGKAKELVLLGKPIEARQAEQIGIVTRLCTREEIESVALKYAKGALSQSRELKRRMQWL